MTTFLYGASLAVIGLHLLCWISGRIGRTHAEIVLRRAKGCPTGEI